MKTLAGFAAACAIAAAQYFTPVPHGPMTAANTTGNGVIEGTVVNQITRERMKKVIVTLMGKVSLTAATDASGHFAFKDLAEGQYTLQAQPLANGNPRQNPSRSVDLAADQHISGITLAVAPPASISGRVVDENEAPMQDCSVSAVTMQDQDGRKVAVHRASAHSDASGNYQLDLAPGKYYIMASCQIQVVLPHPFMDRGSPDIPMERYGPRLYPASAMVENARRISVQAGANVSGIDFQMTPTRGVTVKGRIHAWTPDSVQGGINVMLRPSGEMAAILNTSASRFDPQSGTFHFAAVLPGSYDLIATGAGAYAQASLNIGAAAPDPIELTLAPLPTISGSVRVDGDAKLSLSNRGIYLRQLDNQVMLGPTNAQIKEDGTFHIGGVPPGRWALFMQGNGYIKSMQLNEQDVTPDSFELTSGTPSNTVSIVVGNDWAQVEGTVSGAVQGAQISGVLWSEQGEGRWNMYNRNFFVEPRGHFQISNVAPGKYRVCAVDNPLAMAMLMQHVELRKKIRTQCEAVELEEGGHATIQLTAISREDFDKLMGELDDQ